MHLVRDAQALLGHRQAALADVQVGAVDGERGLGGESRQRLLVFGGELRLVLLLRQIEIAPERRAAQDRHRQQRAHGGVVGRESGRAGVARQIAQAERLALAQRHAEQATALRRRADPAALLLGDAAGHERLDAPGRVVDGERTEAGAEELAGAVHHLLEHGLEVELAGDVERGAVQGEQLGVARLEPEVEPLDEVEQDADQEDRAEHDQGVEQQAGVGVLLVGQQTAPHDVQEDDEQEEPTQGGPLQPRQGHTRSRAGYQGRGRGPSRAPGAGLQGRWCAPPARSTA